MATISISLPSQVTVRLDEEIKKRGFATRSEFIRDLLRRSFAKRIDFVPFQAKPLDEIRSDLIKTGKYSQQFIDDLISGLKKTSAYEDKTT